MHELPKPEKELIKFPEKTNAGPEFFANPPLENTSVIYSIPIQGEWHNGQLLRTLISFFSQHQNVGSAFEIQIITNRDDALTRLIDYDSNPTFASPDKPSGVYDLKEATTPEEKLARLQLDEMAEELSFLKLVIEVQRLAQLLFQSAEVDQATIDHLQQLLTKISDPLQREVLDLAIKSARQIALSVVDATHTCMSATPYKWSSIGAYRSMGVDYARLRFADQADQVFVSLFDGDTVLENNRGVTQLQDIVRRHPQLKYLFSGITYLPAGHSPDFLADAPRQAMYKTWAYGDGWRHGSPQISFRLNVYDTLSEIAGWQRAFFDGDEDRDTSQRLIYHFGQIQENLLMDESAELDFPTTTLTADRADGAVDSKGRMDAFLREGVRSLTEDMGKVFEFRERVAALIFELPSEQQAQAVRFLEKARTHFLRRERVQQRMNKRVVRSFLNAIDKGDIRIKDGQLLYEQSRIAEHQAGTALLQYVRSNEALVMEVLSHAPTSLESLRYYLGESDTAVTSTPTAFELSIREYLGEVSRFDDLLNNLDVQTDTDSYGHPKILVTDLRDYTSRESLLHASIAELLALARTYTVFLETKDFVKEKFKTPLGGYSNPLDSWPIDTSKQKLPMHFGTLEDRLHWIEERQPELQRPLTAGSTTNKSKNAWYRLLSLKSLPILELFKKLTF